MGEKIQKKASELIKNIIGIKTEKTITTIIRNILIVGIRTPIMAKVFFKFFT